MMKLNKYQNLKKDLFDPNNIAALIDKSKEESAEVLKQMTTLLKIKKEM